VIKAESAAFTPKRAFGAATAIGLAVGVGLLVYVLRKYHVTQVLAAVAAAGWGIVWISLFRFVTLASDSAGWRELWLPKRKPRFAALLVFRWIGESVNNLLPVAQLGGQLVRIRLLGRREKDYATAASATVVDFTMGVLTQAIYTAAGVLFLLRFSRARGTELGKAPLLALALLIVGLFALFAFQRGRMLQKCARLIQRALAGNLRDLADQLHTAAQSLDDGINEIYGSRGNLLRSLAWRLLTWLLHTFESWIIMFYLGAPVSWPEALILESLSTAVRNAAFPVPAGLGAQEGGFLLLGAALGISPPIALALSLAKRARELIVGLPALGVWAWFESQFTKNARD
jgi:putative membrane protein